MSAFDRMMGYSAKRGLNETSEVFDVTKPEGAFLNRVHQEGYKMYETGYALKPEYQLDDSDLIGVSDYEAYQDSLFISQEKFDELSDEKKTCYEKQTRMTELHNALTTYGNQTINAVAGSGKALVNGTLVYSSEGFKAIELIKVGDKVCGDDGIFHEVLGVYPQGKKRVYAVHFSDGNVIKCSEDHLWTVVCEDEDLTASVGELAKLKGCIVRNCAETDFLGNWSITVPAYLLGYLLGSDVTVEGDNIMLEVGSEICRDNIIMDMKSYKGAKVERVNGMHLKITDCNQLIEELRDLNFEAFYEIPERYLKCGVSARKKVLYGILDSCSIPRNDLSFDVTTYSDYFRDGLIFLAESLGMTVLVKDLGEGKTLLNIGVADREIVEIKDVGTYMDMTCIQIDSPSHLYLTEHFIPTHNTTALTLKIIHDIVTGEAMTVKQISEGNPVRVVNKMWVCTFLKTGAEELENSLVSWQRKLGYSQTANQISFSTMDAEFKRCLNTMGVATNIGDSGKLYGLFCKAVDSCHITRSNGYPLSKEDYQIISGIVVYFRGRLDDKRYQHPSCKDYGLTPTILDLLVKQYSNLRQSAGVMDFEEIMELLYKYLYVTPNKAVQDFVANRYNFIYVDEFQDTSQMAYAILKFYARGHLWLNKKGEFSDDILYTGEETIGKIVVVGDPSQSIYSFRGSDSSILVNDVDADFRPCFSTLSVNWRCPSEILNPIVPSIHQNRDSASQDIRPANKGGEFFGYAFSSYKTMITQLKDDLYRDMQDGMKVAILCRTNFDGLIPAFILEEDGRFEFSVSGENMTLNSPLPRKLIAVTSLFTERSTQAVKNSLEFFAGRGNSWALKELMDTLKMNNKSIWDVPIADIEYSCPTLVGFVKEIKGVFCDEHGKRDKSKEIDALRVIYTRMIVDVFAGDSAYCESARAYLETLLFLIEDNNFKTIYDFLEEVEYINDKLNGRIKKNKAYINIATVHEYKGKECDSVIVWNDSAGTFPSSKCDLDNEEQVNEERRVHYIACTRAKKRERIYALSSKMGMFALEMDCKFTNPIKPKVSL